MTVTHDYFAAACQAVGIPARVIELNGHVVPEAFLRETGRWIMVDPTLGYYLTRTECLSQLLKLSVHTGRAISRTLQFLQQERGDDSLYRAADEEYPAGDISQRFYRCFQPAPGATADSQLYCGQPLSLPIAKLQYLDSNSVKIGRKESILRSILAAQCISLCSAGC